MGLRKDFLAHKNNAVESFRLVKTDFLNLSAGIENMKSILANFDLKISAIEAEFSDLKNLIDKFSGNLKNIYSENNALSKKIILQSSSIKKLLPRSAKQSLKIRHMDSELRIFQEDMKKLKIFISRKLKSMKRRDGKLNRKIGGRTVRPKLRLPAGGRFD